jgi:hypothetical protein
VVFVQFPFAAEDLGDDAFWAEKRGEVFLAEIVGVLTFPSAWNPAAGGRRRRNGPIPHGLWTLNSEFVTVDPSLSSAP